MTEIVEIYLNWILKTYDMEELELKGETKPEDSVKETDILEETSQENVDHG